MHERAHTHTQTNTHTDKHTHTHIYTISHAQIHLHTIRPHADAHAQQTHTQCPRTKTHTITYQQSRTPRTHALGRSSFGRWSHGAPSPHVPPRTWKRATSRTAGPPSWPTHWPAEGSQHHAGQLSRFQLCHRGSHSSCAHDHTCSLLGWLSFFGLTKVIQGVATCTVPCFDLSQPHHFCTRKILCLTTMSSVLRCLARQHITRLSYSTIIGWTQTGLPPDFWNLLLHSHPPQHTHVPPCLLHYRRSSCPASAQVWSWVLEERQLLKSAGSAGASFMCVKTLGQMRRRRWKSQAICCRYVCLCVCCANVSADYLKVGTYWTCHGHLHKVQSTKLALVLSAFSHLSVWANTCPAAARCDCSYKRVWSAWRRSCWLRTRTCRSASPQTHSPTLMSCQKWWATC